VSRSARNLRSAQLTHFLEALLGPSVPPFGLIGKHYFAIKMLRVALRVHMTVENHRAHS